MSGTCEWPGCDRPATRRQRCQRHYDKLYQAGRLRAELVDPAPTVAHLAELTRRGVTRTSIAARTGLCRSAITQIVAGRHGRIRLTTSDKIMALPLPLEETS